MDQPAPAAQHADDVRDEAHLCLEFHLAIDALTRRYGVINVADRCRIFADLIERAEAGFQQEVGRDEEGTDDE